MEPTERAVEPPSRIVWRARPSGRAATATASGARRRPSDRLLDPDHQALVRIEPLRVGGAPAPDRLVGDGEDPGPRRERLGELLRRHRVHRTEPVLREDLLLGLRLHELDELVREVLVGASLHNSDWELDQHRLPRNHVLDVLALEPGVDRLALVGDENVALT